MTVQTVSSVEGSTAFSSSMNRLQFLAKTRRLRRIFVVGFCVAACVAWPLKAKQDSTTSPQNGQQAGNASPSPDQTAIATGAVRTSDNVAIPGAMVRMTNTATNQAWVTWTDAAGKFEFPALPLGHYRAEASQLGFHADTPAEAQVAANGASSVVVILRVATLAELNAAGAAEGPPRARGGFGGRGGGFGGRGNGGAGAGVGNAANGNGGANGGAARGGF